MGGETAHKLLCTAVIKCCQACKSRGMDSVTERDVIESYFVINMDDTMEQYQFGDRENLWWMENPFCCPNNSNQVMFCKARYIFA